MSFSSMDARLNFENAKNLLSRNNLDISMARLTQSYVRSEVVIESTTAEYSIQTLVNQVNNAGGIFKTERRIALQDWFVVTAIGVFLATPSSATDTSFELLTYNDPAKLTTSGAAAAAGQLYNGLLSLAIDNNKVLPEWDVARHYCVPMQQTVANADYTTSGIAYKNSINLATDGYYPVEPNLIFNGGANLDFKLTLPNAIATVQTNSRIVVVLRGIKAQNVTNVK